MDPIVANARCGDGLGAGAEDAPPRSKAYLAFAIGASAAIFAAALASAVRAAVVAGMCCADDAFLALVARGLALDGIYGLPVSSTEVRVFDPTIGSGPALIMPAALLMRLFGPTTWVPGMTTMLLFALQIAATIVVLSRTFALSGSLLFTACTIAAFAVVGGDHWYLGVFVGEMPAFGFVLLGAVLLAGERRPVWAGLAFGFAFLTKQITLFAVLGVVAAWAGLHLGSGVRAAVRRILEAAAGAAVPVAAFELYKLASLGPYGYLDHLRALVITTSRFAHGQNLPLAERIRTFFDIVTTNYFIDAGVLVATGIALMAILAVARTGSTGAAAARLALMIWAGVFVFLLYILLFSTMWERYFFIGIAMACAGLAVPLLAAPPATGIGFVAVLAVLLFSPGKLIAIRDLHWHRNNSAREIAEFVRHIEQTDAPLLAHWWAEIYDVVYVMPAGRQWVLGGESGKVLGRPFLYVANSYTKVVDAPLFPMVTTRCPLEMSVGNHRLYRCGADFRPY